MNVLLLIIGVVLIWRVVEGFRVGMVKEVISFVSLIVMSIAIVLLGVTLSSYMKKEVMQMVVAVILLLVLCIVHRIIRLIFFSAKMVSHLPVVHGVDRLLGGVVGVLEAVLIVWVMFSLVMSFGMGVPGQQILLSVKESPILTWLYEHNYLAYWIGNLSEKISLPL